MRELTPVNAPTLDWRHRWIRIPLRRLSDAEIAEARRVLREHPDPVWKDASHTAVEWDWVYAASRMDLMEHYRRDPFFDYFIQVFRLGNTAVVAVPGEPFVEEQLRIKLESPAAYTFTAHMSNLYVGYIPTAEAFQRGGYETRTGAGSKLAPEALRLIGDNVLEMLRELFPDADRRGRTAAR
jgi:hypothetical protein